MATGGSGDVLTGLITALACQGLEPYDAARLGVYLHGLAGDLAAEELGQVSMIASDLVRFLPKALKTIGVIAYSAGAARGTVPFSRRKRLFAEQRGPAPRKSGQSPDRLRRPLAPGPAKCYDTSRSSSMFVLPMQYFW